MAAYLHEFYKPKPTPLLDGRNPLDQSRFQLLFIERPVDYLVNIAKYDMRKAMTNAVNWTEQDQHYWNAIIVQAQKEGDAIMPEWDRERNLEADLMRKCRGLDKRARDGVVRNNDYQEIETKKQLKRDLQNGRTYLPVVPIGTTCYGSAPPQTWIPVLMTPPPGMNPETNGQNGNAPAASVDTMPPQPYNSVVNQKPSIGIAADRPEKSKEDVVRVREELRVKTKALAERLPASASTSPKSSAGQTPTSTPSAAMSLDDPSPRVSPQPEAQTNSLDNEFIARAVSDTQVDGVEVVDGDRAVSEAHWLENDNIGGVFSETQASWLKVVNADEAVSEVPSRGDFPALSSALATHGSSPAPVEAQAVVHDHWTKLAIQSAILLAGALAKPHTRTKAQKGRYTSYPAPRGPMARVNATGELRVSDPAVIVANTRVSKQDLLRHLSQTYEIWGRKQPSEEELWDQLADVELEVGSLIAW